MRELNLTLTGLGTGIVVSDSGEGVGMVSVEMGRAGLRQRLTRPWPSAPRFWGPCTKQSKNKN